MGNDLLETDGAPDEVEVEAELPETLELGADRLNRLSDFRPSLSLPEEDVLDGGVWAGGIVGGCTSVLIRYADNRPWTATPSNAEDRWRLGLNMSSEDRGVRMCRGSSGNARTVTSVSQVVHVLDSEADHAQEALVALVEVVVVEYLDRDKREALHITWRRR